LTDLTELSRNPTFTPPVRFDWAPIMVCAVELLGLAFS
jgi:hypothetical protein